MSIGDNIKSLRKENNLTQKELAKKIDISASTIGMYEQNRRDPDTETLRKIAEFFEVSTDYLLGVSDDNKFGNHFFFFFQDDDLKTIFTSRLKLSMEKNNIDVQDILFETEISADNMEKYIEGESEPTLEDLCALSDILDVTTDYLLGRDNSPTTKSQNMMRAFGQLDDDNQDIIIGETKKLLKEQRRYDRPVAAGPAEEPTEMVN